MVCAVILSSGIAAHPSFVGAAEDASEAVRMPTNHRALIARYMLAQEYNDPANLNTAMISKPFGRWGGLLHGGTVPTVCIMMQVPSLFGGTRAGYQLFTVKDGQAQRIDSGNALIDTCPPLSPFNEVRKKP